MGEDPEKCPDSLRRWHPLSPTVVGAVRDTVPEALWAVCSPQLFVLYWVLTSHDIATPHASYAAAKVL